MLLADDLRGKRPGGRGERINCGIDTQFRDRAVQNDGCIQVRKRCGWRRIRQVVGRNLHRLKGGDGAFLGGGDAFLKGPHFGSEGRLVANGTGSAA